MAAAVMLAPAMAVAQGGLPTCSSNPAASPFASGLPVLWAFAGNACRDLSSYIVSGPNGQWTVNTPKLEVGSGAVQVQGVLDSDPFISFGATTTNLSGSALTFAFLFGTPITPGFYSTATSTGGVTVTNGRGGTTTVAANGVYPTFISAYGTLGFVPTNLGVDLGTAPCVASGAPSSVTTTCSQGTAANGFGNTFYDNLEGLLTYTQDDLGSVASWSGAVTLEASTTFTTPEPGTIGLFASGLLLIGSVSLRRRSS